MATFEWISVTGDIREIFNIFHKTRQTALDKTNARALAEFVEEQAERMGLPEAPEIIHLDHRLPMAACAFGRETPQSPVKPYLAITEGALKKVFDSPRLHTEVPDGLKAIIGHEMSHALDGVRRTHLERVPLFAMPLVAVAGFEMLRRAQRRHEADPSKPPSAHLDDAADEMHKDAGANGPHRYASIEKSTIHWGRHLNDAVTGLWAGGFISNRMSVAGEFRADRMGVTASGNPKAMIDALTRFDKSIAEVVDPQMKEWAKGFSTRGLQENISQIYVLAKETFASMTYSAHPSHAARVRAITKFAEQSGLGHGVRI